jgi:hypothetical protein
MSALPDSPAAPPRRRAREVTARADDEIVRGAPAETLDQPAGHFLESVRWAGPDPDPDSLSAQAFLGWL